MNNLSQAIRSIVARSSSLFERIDSKNITFGSSDWQTAKRHLSTWGQIIAKGNGPKFEKRLDWDNLDVMKVSIFLGSPPIFDSENFPSWAEILQEMILKMQETAQQEVQRQNLPFAEILMPALEIARSRLFTRLEISDFLSNQLPLNILSEPAYVSLEQTLLLNLVNMSRPTLELEFSKHQSFGGNLLNLLKNPQTSQVDFAHYQAFIHQILSESIEFFQSYPVLGRLLAITIQFWVEATAEFLEHLQAGLSEIQQIFTNQSLGKVIQIQTALSDPHNQHRCVHSLTFESGLKLIYKPKDLATEVAYTQLLDWCNQQGILLPFKVIKICNRHTHGWVEYVEHKPCENEAEAQRFYQRTGMLLCLLYALRVVDCHRENLIAHGEHFVLIDMETLMHHEAKPMADFPEMTAAQTSVDELFWDSVLKVGLLPRWEFSKDGKLAYDISALGSFDASSESKIPANLPILNHQVLSANHYLNELIAGFEQMYHFLMSRREILLSEKSPLLSLRSSRVRFIFRATKVYWILLQKSLSPEFLRDGIARSIALDFLSRAFLTVEEKPLAWPILHAELKAVEQLDIPYFAASPESDALTIGLENPIESYFESPSYHQVITRIKNFSETDLSQQIEVIKGSLYAKLARTSTEIDSSQILPLKLEDLSQITPLNSEQLITEATRLAHEIQHREIRGKDGSVKWIGFGYVPQADRFQLMPLDDSLYDGNGGIALFLAALDFVRGTQEFQETVLGACYTLQKILHSGDKEALQRLVRQGIGGATGIGSMIYSLVKISQFLNHDQLLKDAQQLAHLITPASIQNDDVLDITAGSAGALLGLLSLYEKTQHSQPLETAICCAEHLLSQLVSVNNKPRAWKILKGQQYTGFSHGAAGIVYALLRLYNITRNPAYLEAASEGIAYEASVFSTIVNNWPDFREFAMKNGQPGFMVSWCHGAAGIGLSRLGGLSILNTDKVQQDIEIALQTIQNHSLQDVDCVCCGNFGRIETLLVAAQKLAQPHWQETALQKATWVVARAKKMGGYQFPNLPTTVFTPSFFQGTAGIGYELLRLAFPENLPCVLLWE